MLYPVKLVCAIQIYNYFVNLFYIVYLMSKNNYKLGTFLNFTLS